MRAQFEGQLSASIMKAMNDNGVNPTGTELKAITLAVSNFVQTEVEFIVSDNEELSRVQGEIKAKQEAAATVKAENEQKLAENPPATAAAVDGPVVLAVSPTAGQVGSTVTIKGHSFWQTQGSSTVTFNGVAAKASTWDKNVIVASVPVGATTGELVVTVSGLTSAGVPYTVLP